MAGANRPGRSLHWVRVKNRTHKALNRVKNSFRPGTVCLHKCLASVSVALGVAWAA